MAYAALRKSSASDAKWYEKLATWYIKDRLATVYPHGGMVVGDVLYHASARAGLVAVPFTPENWVLYDIGPERDQFIQDLYVAVKARQAKYKGNGYDWFELFDFTWLRPFLALARLVPSVREWLEQLLYCYQWMFLCMTGLYPKGRVVPETILDLVAAHRKPLGAPMPDAAA